MKLWLIPAMVLTIGVLAGAQSGSSGGVHIDPAKVAAARRQASASSGRIAK